MKQLLIDTKNVGYVKIFKDELKNSQTFEDYKNLTNATVEREGTNDEFLVFRTFKNPQNFSTTYYKISQYNKYFNEHCSDFGTFDDFDAAVEAMKIGFEELYTGFADEVYENGSNQWITDKYNFGVMIEEMQFETTNTFGEV
ncbi:MAG: hypothetical protein PHE16_02990 [Aliarcobacter sp.]|nr:hypothetical protein [Aliarcobacter sp.]